MPMKSFRQSPAFAPIILFAYNRPKHTQKVLEALRSNYLAEQSDVCIYVDGAKGETDRDDVELTKSVVKSITGFKSTTIVERECNYGLAKNIIDGVSENLKKYDRCIVLEDDILTSPSFLSYMNNSLLKFQDVSEVWHVNAWVQSLKNQGQDEYFFWRVMNCWGWGTWWDRWIHEKNQ